ncbi:MAG: serpin family protein [bacterium]|nr:serpin family protein [bacterium]
MKQENNSNIQAKQEEIDNVSQQNDATVQSKNNKTKISSPKHKKINIWLIISIIIILLLIITCLIFILGDKKRESSIKTDLEPKKSAYWISSNSLEAFDLYFLQLENSKQNKIYSPLSIKYALEMLEDGTTGAAKDQIASVIGNYEAKKYTNSKNLSFANAMFIKDKYKNSIKDNYKETLTNKYNAEIKIDSFENPNTINSWVSDKTLGLINNLFDNVSENNFLLINALAIDMEWNQKFILKSGSGIYTKYYHENFSWRGDSDVVANNFQNVEEKVSGMEIIASINNYDIVNVLGEENIRQTVKSEFEKYLQENTWDSIASYINDRNITGLSNDELMEKYLDQYIEEINSNYKSEDKTTEFSFYVDENVKAFAKDLKEYDGTTLQYVSIMPTSEDLDSYISNTNVKNINNILENLKELKTENFKDGVVTKIKGFIPKFKFEYQLDLIQDLKKLGISDVFESGKANLTNITEDEAIYITDAKHKANIELTQEGIKASAATAIFAGGSTATFDYLYDVPVEEIDLTFDKPYMFIIRDKNSNEVWFAGTVYNPLLYSLDMTKAPNY